MPTSRFAILSFDQLLSLREKWLHEGIDSHVIEDARLIARYLGQPFIVENWSSDNWVWTYNNVTVKLYSFTTHHFMEDLPNGVKNNAWNRVETVVITVDGQVHCRYKTATDPQYIQGMDWEDAVFIPGKWMNIIAVFKDEVEKTRHQHQEEHDTLAIKRLKTMLLLD